MSLAYFLHICNMTAAQASMMVVALYAAHIGAGALAIGALVSVSALAPVVLGVHAGRMSDRIGVRAPMLAGSAMMAGALALAALVPGLPAQFVAVTTIGLGYLFYMIAQQSMVGALSTKATRSRNFANQTLIASIARFIGPLAAGFLIEHQGYAVTFGALALLPAVAAATLAGGHAARICPRARAELVPQDKAPMLELVRNRPLLSIAATSGLVLTCVDLFQFYAPLHARAAGLSPSEIGAVMSAYAAGAIVVRSVMPQLIALCRMEERLLAATLAVAMLSYAVFPLAAGAWTLGAFAFVLGAGLGCAQPLSMMLTYTYSPAGRSGEGLGLRFMISNAARLVLPLAFGPLSAALGLLSVFWSNVAILAGGTVLTQRLVDGATERARELDATGGKGLKPSARAGS